MTVAVVILLGVVGVAAIAGIFQHAELAQLPRELAEATQLLARFRWLAREGVDLGRPLPPDTREPVWRWLTALVAPCVVAALLVVLSEFDDLGVAVAAVACVVLVALLKRVIAEFSSADRQARAGAEGTPPDSLADLIGRYRLDEYVTDPDVAGEVDDAIRQLPGMPRKRPQAEPVPKASGFHRARQRVRAHLKGRQRKRAE